MRPHPGESYFDGRVLVEIEAWEGNLHIGLSSDLTPHEYRFQGGLNYVRGFDISGRIVAPKHHRGRPIGLRLRPFGPDLRFGPEELDEVGQLQLDDVETLSAGFTGSLLFPEATLPTMATCLSAVWKYLHISTFDERTGQASVSAFSFSSSIHKNLQAWAT